MRLLKHTFVLILTLIGFALNGQSEEVFSYELQKGEVLDILLLDQRPDTKEELGNYFEVAFPVARRMSYTPLPGFALGELTQGNHSPEVLALGKWGSMVQREAFLTDILKEVPDFHERRRSIWSYFGLTYYEMAEDIRFEIDKNKHNVITAYWQEPGANLAQLREELVALVAQQRGKVVLTLANGTSPFGYYFQPDFLIISSWDDSTDLEAFQEAQHQLDLNGVQHLNQFNLK